MKKKKSESEGEDKVIFIDKDGQEYTKGSLQEIINAMNKLKEALLALDYYSNVIDY